MKILGVHFVKGINIRAHHIGDKLIGSKLLPSKVNHIYFKTERMKNVLSSLLIYF